MDLPELRIKNVRCQSAATHLIHTKVDGRYQHSKDMGLQIGPKPPVNSAKERKGKERNGKEWKGKGQLFPFQHEEMWVGHL